MLRLFLHLRYLLEAAAAVLLFGIFGALPFPLASRIGGMIGKAVGPLLSVTRIARRNLARAMPELSEHEINRIVLGMWEHLGRVVGEIPHVARMDSTTFQRYVTFVNGEALIPLKEHGGFCVSGHFGNWELSPRVAKEFGLPLALVYRSSNNPYVDSLIQWMRGHFQIRGIPKGAKGAKSLLASIQAKEVIGILVDQKMNDGIPIPFFGMDAMTAPAVANLAIRYGRPIVPTRIVRTVSEDGKNLHFTFTVYPPITIPDTSDKNAAIIQIMTEINTVLESWIREYPEQWFWVHRRWPKE
ncbi:MAG: lauroyl acyltransferase [Rickettsiales bacterium]|jgi:KDO2-lipid IV(A) lauroyltransferase|nr:lauroyl acyltransferase [Rickettsiales bacterium]